MTQCIRDLVTCCHAWNKFSFDEAQLRLAKNVALNGGGGEPPSEIDIEISSKPLRERNPECCQEFVEVLRRADRSVCLAFALAFLFGSCVPVHLFRIRTKSGYRLYTGPAPVAAARWKRQRRLLRLYIPEFARRAYGRSWIFSPLLRAVDAEDARRGALPRRSHVLRGARRRRSTAKRQLPKSCFTA